MANGDGQQGGYIGGMLGQPGTREVIRRTERDEIHADDARGWRVIGLNVAIVFVFLSAVVALGRYGAAILPSVLLVMLAIVVMGWLTASDDDGTLAPDGNYKTARAVWIVLVIFSVAWIALCMFEPSIRDSAMGAYPLKFSLPWWAIVFVFSILGAVMYGLLDLRYSHRSSLFNRNWPPTYQQLDPRIGPYYDGGPTWLDDEVTQEQEYPLTRDEIADLLAEAMDNKPIVREETIVVSNRQRNGNGLHKSPTPGTDERIIREEAEQIKRKTDRHGNIYFRMVQGRYRSAWVPKTMVRDFIVQAPTLGSSFSKCAARGITESHLITIRRALAHADIVDLGNSSIHEELEWLLEPADALAEFDRIFKAQAPPRPTPTV